jgi:hypothetical protein|tara:strand:- start:113 stop:538 length:426 start_codon:yes stop_codon:yes gene_type:complete
MFTTQADVRVKDFPDFIETLIEQFKSEKFRVGFIKKDGTKRVGSFDLMHRVRWKQSDGTMYKRKGKARTTDKDAYLLAHDLKKKAPRNISYATMKWLNVGKKFYKIKHLKTKVKVIEFPKVTFDMREALDKGNWEVLESIK